MHFNFVMQVTRQSSLFRSTETLLVEGLHILSLLTVNVPILQAKVAVRYRVAQAVPRLNEA